MNKKIIIVLAAAALAVGLVRATLPASDDALIRLDKKDMVRVPADLLPDLRGVVELNRSWIIVAADEELAELAARRIPFEILDIAPAGKAYFLVSTLHPGQAGTLRSYGEVRVLDELVALFWAGDQEAREVLPPEFEIARVSLELRVPVVPADRAGRDAFRPAVLLRHAPSSDTLIPQMVDQVTKADLTSFIAALESFRTRYASTPQCEATGTFLQNFFSSEGLATELDTFQFPASSAYTTRNIIAVIPGKSSSDRVVIVGAHYDSFSNDRYNLAPGADDNGSGTAAVMEIAKILSKYQFDFTLKFIGFSAEEWGLYGSKHYAQEAKAAEEKIIAVINMDMIAYPDRLPEDLDVIANGASEWLANRMIVTADRYAPLPVLKIVNASFRSSDHSPFWDQGYSAFCAIEDAGVPNPYYHKTTDTLSTLDMDFALSVAKAVLALAADLAQPIVSLPAPSGFEVRSQISASLFSRRKTIRLQWNATPGAMGYNLYRAGQSHGNFAKLNAALLTQTHALDGPLSPDLGHYYVVTAVDAQGRESNYSIELLDPARK